MKSDMKKNLSRLVALGLCWYWAPREGRPDRPDRPFRFRVSIQNPEVVETRSCRQ